MLVHVHDDQRHAADRARGVIGGEVIDQPLVARRVGQDHQALAVGHRLAHGGEFRLPAIEADEIPADRLREHAGRVGRRVADALEIELVQQRGIVDRLLLALELADLARLGLGEIDLGELLGDGVQPVDALGIDRMMFGDRLRRQPLDLVGIEGERLGAELGRTRDGQQLLRRSRHGHGAGQQADARSQGAARDLGHVGLRRLFEP